MMWPRLSLWPLALTPDGQRAPACAVWGWPVELAEREPVPNRRRWRKLRLQVLDRDGWLVFGTAVKAKWMHGSVTIGYLLTLLRTACMTFPISRVSVPPVIGRNHAVNDRGGSLTPKWLNGGGT